jgi:hypothetical protein
MPVLDSSSDNPVAYLFPSIRDRVNRAIEQLDSSPAVQAAARTLVGIDPVEPAMLSVPLLVHAAETGDPEPAVPISAIHYLWWRAAHVLIAAVVGGTALPAAIAVSDLPATILPNAVNDFFAAWIFSNDGQAPRKSESRSGRTSGLRWVCWVSSATTRRTW